MQVDGRIGPLTGDPHGVGQAARIDVAARRGAPARAPDAPPTRAGAREPAEDVLDLDGEPYGKLTVRGLEVAFDAFRDRELDLLERWSDARVDHERRRALETAEQAIADARRATEEHEPAEQGATTAADEGGAPSGLPLEGVSLPPLSRPEGAGTARDPDPRVHEAHGGARADEPRAEGPQPARAGYLALPPEPGLVVDVSA